MIVVDEEDLENEDDPTPSSTSADSSSPTSLNKSPMQSSGPPIPLIIFKVSIFLFFCLSRIQSLCSQFKFYYWVFNFFKKFKNLGFLKTKRQLHLPFCTFNILEKYYQTLLQNSIERGVEIPKLIDTKYI